MPTVTKTLIFGTDFDRSNDLYFDGLIMFYEMRVFRRCVFTDFFENLKGEKRTCANLMGSIQLKSLYNIDKFTFLFT